MDLVEILRLIVLVFVTPYHFFNLIKWINSRNANYGIWVVFTYLVIHNLIKS